MKSFAQRPAAIAPFAEAGQTVCSPHCSTAYSPCRHLFCTARSLTAHSFRDAARNPSVAPSFYTVAITIFNRTSNASAAHCTSRRHFTPSGSMYEVINPDEIAFLDDSPNTSVNEDGSAGTFGTTYSETISFKSSLAWSTTLSATLPSAFTDVEEVDSFARPRMLSFVRRYRTATDENTNTLSTPNNPSSSSNNNNGAEFITEEVPQGGMFHARLRLPVTRAAARFLGCNDAVEFGDGLWAHGVANTAKDAELLAAMHAERMADLLGYHLYALPSRQRKHAAAARQAGRYASSPDDAGSGPSAQERREQWPLPLRRVLTDEETEGGKWQLVDTTTAAARLIGPEHTLLSPCLLDPRARTRIEARFAAAPSGCPSFMQQLSVEKVRTLTASSVADGGAESMVAQLTLPPQLTTLAEPIVAAGKAEDRVTAVLLACMHAELLLDVLYIPLFDDPAKQAQHTAAAWSFGRPAPMAGAKPRNPSHVHLPEPLKQLIFSGSQRTAMRSAEEDYFHRHHIVAEQTGSFIETTVGESNAIAVLSRFLDVHNATRAAAPFLQTSVAGRIRSTVLLPLPESYGIRGGVGIAANAHDADTLAAMHALDVLCMLDIPIMMNKIDLAAGADAAWKAARRARISNVPAAVSDVSTPSPPARRCSSRTFVSTVSVEVEPAFDGTLNNTAAAASVTENTAESSTHRASGRRVVKRAKLASEATIGPDTSNPATKPEPTATTATPSAHAAPSSLPSSSLPYPAQNEAAEREAHLAARRTIVDAELWDLKADCPDGYIMIAPGAQQASAISEYSIVSPRKLDKQAKARLIEYLSSVGRRLEDVQVKQSLSEEETDGRPRHRCALRLPLPAACGEPRLALGEADTATDAEHAACMHAELLLDALGVCIYTDAVKQLRHAEACAQWGRWAPTGPGQEKPPTTPSPPPLRREPIGSLHWVRKNSETKRAAGQRLPLPLTESATPAPMIESTAAKQKRTQESHIASTKDNDTTLCDCVAEADIDFVARSRVQYFLRHERLTVGLPTFTSQMGRGLLTHVATWELPIPARFSGKAGQSAVPKAASTLSYTVKGIASTRRDADTLAWMHAERLLDALDIPLFPNLPLLQAYHASQAEKQGRHAPKHTDGPQTPLPPADQPPLKPLRLHNSVRGFNIVRPEVPTLEEAASTQLWEKYVTACEAYITATQYVMSTAFFNEDRVPRTGDTVVDAALAEAEAAPVEKQARNLLMLYTSLAKYEPAHGWVVRTTGELTHRVVYATFPTPGHEYILAQGVGANKSIAQLRASMHALALLRRIDPNYEDLYAAAKTAMMHDVNKSIDGNTAAGAEGKKEDMDDFDLDTFSTLPSINAEVYRIDNLRSKRFARRLAKRFVEDSARFAQSSEFTDDGKRRAVQLYTLCCGVAKPIERTLVRLLPRHEETPATETPVKSDLALQLELQVKSPTDGDPKTRRVPIGAAYAMEVSITDEEGRLWTGRGDGFGLQDNRNDAYDKLYQLMLKNLPLMLKINEILRVEIFLRPEEIPCVEIPGTVSERIQACLRNQKDLLLAENDTSTWDSQKWEEATGQRFKERMTHAKMLDGSEATPPPQLAVAAAAGNERAAATAAESAALLKQLQQRNTNPEYLETYALKRSKLSIAEHKVEILKSIRSNPVTIICGTTGCGKTTQIPQYILDEAIQNGMGGQCNVIVTQPRRLSAVSIAKRVAAERMENVGDTTGFMIRFSSFPGRHINFVTTGVLLRLLRTEPGLPNYTHVIIDEIHERELMTDFLLILLRDLVARRPDLRIILMSATLQASEFQRYYDGAPLIQVQGHMFPVKEMFLEDLVPYAREQERMTPLLKEAEIVSKVNGGGVGGGDSNGITAAAAGALKAEQAASAASNIRIHNSTHLRYDVLQVSSRLDYPTITFAIEQAARMINLDGSSILVFLPGWWEIKMMQQQLEFNNAFYVLLLHSAVGQDAQMRCFLPAPPGKIKVILSTNIAESGVTIDDVGAVIDCGRLKEKSYATRARVIVPRTMETGYDFFSVTDNSRVSRVEGDGVRSQSSFTQLLEVYASRANCVQRRGRVGRTRPGICIRLYSRNHFESLHQYQTPEMLRTPLDALCLAILAMRIDSPATFLSRALEPPLESEVTASMQRLMDLGAVTPEGQLTALGHRLSQLPVHPAVGKTILLGAALRCLDSALTVAAAAQCNLFVTSRDERKAVRLHREDLSMGTISDSLASLNAYNFWVVSKLHKPPAEVALDLKSRCLNVPGLLQTSHLKRQLFGLLVDSGFVSIEAYKSTMSTDKEKQHFGHVFVDTSEYSRNSCDVGLVKSVVAAGLFPNVAMLAGPCTLRTGFENFIKASVDSVLPRSHLTSTSNPYLVFRELTRLNEVKALTAQEITSVSHWVIFLMSTSPMSMEYDQDLSLCVVSKWMYFRVSYRVLEQIRKFKALLDRRLSRKFVDPDDPVNNAQLELICGIISDLLNSPIHPSKELSPTTVWEEKGRIIDPKLGVPRLIGDITEDDEADDVVDEGDEWE